MSETTGIWHDAAACLFMVCAMALNFWYGQPATWPGGRDAIGLDGGIFYCLMLAGASLCMLLPCLGGRGDSRLRLHAPSCAVGGAICSGAVVALSALGLPGSAPICVAAALNGFAYALAIIGWSLSLSRRGSAVVICNGSVALVACGALCLVIARLGSAPPLGLSAAVWAAQMTCALVLLRTGKGNACDVATPSQADGENSAIRLPELACSLLIFCGFVLSVNDKSVSGSQMSDWATGAVVAGALFLCVARLAPRPKVFDAVFVATSMVVCVALVVGLFADRPFGSVAPVLAMTGVWLLFLLAAASQAGQGPSMLARGSARIMLAYYAVYFGAQCVGTLLNHLPADGPAKQIASIALLMASIALAFYRLGSTGTNARPSREHASEALLARVDADSRQLTAREREILVQLALGNSLQQTAQDLGLSPNTVKTYRTSLYAKLDVHSRQELVNMLRDCEEGLVPNGGILRGARERDENREK